MQFPEYKKSTDNKDIPNLDDLLLWDEGELSLILKDIKIEDSPLIKAIKEADERNNKVEKELTVATQRLNSLTNRVNFLEETLSKQTQTLDILLNNLKNKGE